MVRAETQNLFSHEPPEFRKGCHLSFLRRTLDNVFLAQFVYSSDVREFKNKNVLIVLILINREWAMLNIPGNT